MSLVEELKQQHKIILDKLDQVRSIGSSTAESLKILEEVKSTLFSHIKKEDELLYPALNQAAATDPSLKAYLEMYAMDMQEVSTEVLDFYGKHTGPAAKPGHPDFIYDFERVLYNLQRRIKNEENSLYVKFSKL